MTTTTARRARARSSSVASMRRDEIIAWLRAPPCEERPCGDAIDWLQTLPAKTSWRDIWRSCERGDWLLWLCWLLHVDQHWIALAVCSCVRGVWPRLTDERSRRVIEVVELWSRGMASPQELSDAWEAAANAADHVADADWPFASAAADAAWAAGAAAIDVGEDIIWMATSDAWIAPDAVARVARGDVAALKSCARRVRRIIPWRLVRDGLRGQR